MSEDRRAQLRARIQATSRDEVILEEMIRRGFWRAGEGQPSLPEALIRRQGEVRRELENLSKDVAAYQNPERALKLIRLERMKEARERRKETKRRRAEARFARAKTWHQKQRTQITHLGEGVSSALAAKNMPETAKPLRPGLPAIADAAALAKLMGIKLGELRFLAYDRKVAKVDHYARFTIPKRSGGVREIAAPMPRLKRAQYWILANILEPIAPDEAAHGFRAGRSILTNARPHAGQRVVVNLDLKDFFPTIGYRRVKGYFASLGYGEPVAAILALIATDAERDRMEIDGQTWSIARGERRLPQGAPTSPALANLIARRLDRRVVGAARKLGFRYTRYADDMTFSGPFEPNSPEVERLLWQLGKIAEAEGFTFNPQKTHVMGSGSRQEVTGLVVNQMPAVPRGERRRFRAWLHQAEAARARGAELPPWINGKGAASDALGFASYLAMVDPETGPALVARTKTLTSGPARTRSTPPLKTGPDFRTASAEGKPPRDNWWTPADPPEPVPPKLDAAKAANQAQRPAAATAVPQVPPSPWGRGPAPGSPPAASTGDSMRTLRNRVRQSSATPPPATSPSSASPGAGRKSLTTAVLLSLAAMALVLVPGVGVLLFGVALAFIWSGYLRK